MGNRQIQVAEALGVGHHLDFDDLSAHDPEREDDPRPSPLGPDGSRGPVDERWLSGAGTPREGLADGLRTSDLARCPIAQARLEADGVLMVGSDGHPKYLPTVGDHLAIALSGTDKGRLTKIFNDLATGGQRKGPLTAQPGGSEVGWLTDKFGINWMVSIDKA